MGLVFTAETFASTILLLRNLTLPHLASIWVPRDQFAMTATVVGAMMIAEEATAIDVTTIAVIITVQVAADTTIEMAATESLTVLVGLVTLMKVAAGEMITATINTTSKTSMPTMIMIGEVPDEADTPLLLLVLLLPPPPKYLGISFRLFSVAKNSARVNQTHCAYPKKTQNIKMQCAKARNKLFRIL